MQRAVLAAQERHRLFPLPEADTRLPLRAVVIVGVSGGVDSVCLAHALHALAGPLGLAIHIAHVDHGLRPDAGADAAFVAETARAWGVPCHVAQVAVERGPAPGRAAEGVEAAARRARYAALRRIALDVTPPGQTPVVAVAHSMDDQAETVLLRLARGSGAAGLAAMRPVAQLEAGPESEGAASPPVRLVRPLLAVRRSALLDYAARHGLAWVEDPTNADPAFARNRVRHVILPELARVNPGVVEVLARTAEVMAHEAGRLAALDAALLALLALEQAAGVRAVLDLAGLRALGRADQLGALRAALAAAFPANEAIAYDQIGRILDRLATAPGGSGPHPLAGGLAWTAVRARPRCDGETGGAALCLHRAGALPYEPEHPWLPPGHAPLPLAVPSVTAVTTVTTVTTAGAGWRLHVAPAGEDASREARAGWRARLAVPEGAALLLATPRPGLRVTPLGMGGGRKTLGDYFTARKVTPALRAGWPLVVDGESGSVLWVCGLGVMEGRAGRAVEMWWEWET